MRRLLAALACATVAACATHAPVAPPAAPFAPAPRAASLRVTPGGELVAYLARIRGLGERALGQEISRQREAARGSAAPLESVKLALALSLAPSGDEGEITTLMEPVARRTSVDDDVRAMASFLLIQAAERRRLKEGAAATGGRLREERRAHEAQKQRADALQERAAELQQKLQALTELEKSLSDRQSQNR